MERRQFIRTSALSIGALAFLKPDIFGKDFFVDPWKIRMLRNDVGIFTERGGTIGFLVNKKGIVVVDSQFPDTSAHLLAELKKKEKAFKYLINTHHHGDHSSGNITFKGIAEHVVGHTNCLANQRRVAESQNSVDKQLFADITFTESWKGKVGNEKIKTYYFGAAHTNGDAIIHFQHANIAHMGDLVFNRRYPVIDRSAGANIKNWITVLEISLNTFDDQTIFIFGHAFDPGKVTGDKSDLRAFQNYLSKLLEFVQSEITAGKTKEEILTAKAIPGAPEWQGMGIEKSIQAAWEELTTGVK
ncbi:MAG: MBL fold metallo-hydrolase [Dyadobacter sp.]